MSNDLERNMPFSDETTARPSSAFMPTLEDEETILEMGDDFNIDGFQVVRREFFAHLREPSITFNDRKVYVNAACLAKFPHVEYVQALINPETKIFALRPCSEGSRGSFQWCLDSKGKRKPKPTTCTLFFAKLFAMMDWNTDYRYKMLGNVIHANGEYLIAFDLTSTEVYQKVFNEDKKPVISRKAVFPAGWKDQFGLPFHEHRQSMLVNIFDGYAIYTIKDNEKAKAAAPVPEPVNSTLSTSSTGGLSYE